jgi:hypothetical protein
MNIFPRKEINKKTKNNFRAVLIEYKILYRVAIYILPIQKKLHHEKNMMMG